MPDSETSHAVSSSASDRANASAATDGATTGWDNLPPPGPEYLVTKGGWPRDDQLLSATERATIPGSAAGTAAPDRNDGGD